MKILYLHSTPYYSSTANLIQVRSMCNAMVEAGHEVILSIPSYKKNIHVNKQDEFHIENRKPLINIRKIDKYINITSINRSILKHKPDLLYLRTPYLLFQTRFYNIPTVLELHNNKLHLGSKYLDFFWRFQLKKFSKNNYLKKIVCISQALADYWINQGLPKHKVLTAHDAIDRNQYKVQLDRNEARTLIGIDSNKTIITYSGRLYKNRKIENVLLLAKAYPNVLFMIIGGPNQAAKELAYIAHNENLDNVILTGQVPHTEIPKYLYGSDILLGLWSSDVKTINYCSPLKLFEYMGAGRTIVAHGFPTILEVLKDGHNAIICKPDSGQDLIEKVGNALAITETGYTEMGNTARTEVLEKFTWQHRSFYILKGLS